MESAKILLVDDNPANLMALEAVLDQVPYELVKASSGFQALEFVKTQEFAAIILDIQMPGLDGYETALRMRALPRAREIPIIFITAHYKADAEVQRGYEVGALDYLGKPFNPEVLKRKVKIYADLYVKGNLAREREALQELVRELSWKEKALRALLETAEEGIILVGPRGAILSMNEAAVRLWSGRTGARPPGSADYKQWLAENGGGFVSGAWEIEQALENGGVLRNVTADIRRFDHTQAKVVNSASPMKDDTGAVIGHAWVLREAAA